MKKKILLTLLMSLNIVSLFSCGNGVNSTKNTVNYRIGYDSKNLMCKIIIPKDFNYEKLVVKSYETINNENFKGECKVVQLGIDSENNNYFLKDNKYIKEVYIESEYISTFPYDIFRNSSVEHIDLSKATGLKVMGDHVFAYSSLKTIVMPENLETLYKGAFISTNVREVIFSDTLKEIGINTFFNTKDLIKVNFGNTLSKIPGSTFEHSSICTVIGDNVSYIDDYAFKNALNLDKIEFSNLNYIGKEAFLNTSLKNISLDNCVIKPDAFRGSKLESISINNCDNIEYGAFKNCSYLKEVNLNGNIYQIVSNAFRETKLENLSLPDTVTFIGSEAFKDCTSLKTIKLSSSLESISSDAFRNCTSLKEINFPSSIKRIYPGAFVNTSLTKVSLPRDVEILGTAFPKNCEITYF